MTRLTPLDGHRVAGHRPVRPGRPPGHARAAAGGRRPVRHAGGRTGASRRRATRASSGATPSAVAAGGVGLASRPALLPLVYLVIRAAGTEADALAFSLRPRTVVVLVSTLVLALVVGVGTIADRRPDRLAHDPHRPARPAALGGADRRPARDPVVRDWLRVHRGVRARGARCSAARAVRRGAAAGDLRPARGGARADARDVPVRRPRRAGGAAARRTEPSRRPRGRSATAARGLPPGHAAAPRAGHRRRGAARGAVRALRLRGRVAAPVRQLQPGDLPPVPGVVRPVARGGPGPRPRRADARRHWARRASAGGRGTYAGAAGAPAGPSRRRWVAGAGRRSPSWRPSSGSRSSSRRRRSAGG